MTFLSQYTGKPSPHYQESNPDWAPSLMMGYEATSSSSTCSDRYSRLQSREKRRKVDRNGSERNTVAQVCNDEYDDDMPPYEVDERHLESTSELTTIQQYQFSVYATICLFL